MKTVRCEEFNQDGDVFVMTSTDKRYVANDLTKLVQMICADWKRGAASKVMSITQLDSEVSKVVSMSGVL